MITTAASVEPAQLIFFVVTGMHSMRLRFASADATRSAIIQKDWYQLSFPTATMLFLVRK